MKNSINIFKKIKERWNNFNSQAYEKESVILYNGKQDISYKGFLSWRGLKVIAFFILFLSQITLLLPIMSKAYFGKTFDTSNSAWVLIIQVINSAYSPLLFIATFSRILNDPKLIKKNLLTYGLITLGIYAGFNIANIRYAASFIWSVRDIAFPGQINNWGDAINQGNIITLSFYQKFFSVNIFCDVFLWSLVYLFGVYTPTKGFFGKHLKLFRLITILPVSYICLSCVICVLSKSGYINVQIWYLPLLGSGIPLMYMLFGAVILFLVLSKKKFKRKGGNVEEYEFFRVSNYHSLSFSFFCAMFMIAFSVIDFSFLQYFISLAEEDSIIHTYSFGLCYGMVFGAPLMILFSYSKTPKWKLIDMICKTVFIAVVVFLYVDSYFLYACQVIDEVSHKVGDIALESSRFLL